MNFVMGTIGANAELIIDVDRYGLFTLPSNVNDDSGLYGVIGLSAPTKVISGSATTNQAFNPQKGAEWDGVFYGGSVSTPFAGPTVWGFGGGGWYGINGGGQAGEGLPVDGEAVYYVPLCTME